MSILTPEQVAAHVLAPQPGFIYEPRALWVANRDYDLDLRGDWPSRWEQGGERTTHQEELYNGSKYPMILTHIIFDNNVSELQARGTMGTMGIKLSSSGNQKLTRGWMLMSSLVSPSTFEPPAPHWDGAPGLAQPDQALYISGFQGGPVHNVAEWDFPHALHLPKDGAIEFGLGSRIIPNSQDLGIETEVDTLINASVLFSEVGDAATGSFQGNVRNYSPTQRRLQNQGQWGEWDPASELGGVGSAQQYPPGTVLSAKQFRTQNVTQSGTSRVTGFRVMLDQRPYDDAVRTGLADPTFALASLISSTPVKARCAGHGSGEWWWREGAPLSLVTPTRTPAMVGKLKTPISLQPGDSLEVLLSQPAFTNQGFGLSFTGFAAIEG